MNNSVELASAVYNLQIASAFTGIIAAALWWRSTLLRAPPHIVDSGKNIQEYMDRVSARNQIAALVTGISVALSACATLITRLQ